MWNLTPIEESENDTHGLLIWKLWLTSFLKKTFQDLAVQWLFTFFGSNTLPKNLTPENISNACFPQRIPLLTFIFRVWKITQHLKVLKVPLYIFYLLYKGMFIKQLVSDVGLFGKCKKRRKGTQGLRKANKKFATWLFWI